MFYAYIPLFSYMGANLGQMPAAIAAAAAARDSSRRPGYGQNYFQIKPSLCDVSSEICVGEKWGGGTWGSPPPKTLS